MARIVLGPNVVDIRGRFGSIVYSIWKTGVQYMRQAANVIYNPQSIQQAVIRDSMTTLSKHWYDSLTSDQREEWNDWAQTQPRKGNKDGGIYNIIKGNGGVMSGFNAFILANQMLKTIALGPVFNAPLGLTPPSAPKDVAASWADPLIWVTWTQPDLKKAGAMCRIWLAQHEKALHRQMVTYQIPAGSPMSMAGAMGAGGAGIAFANCPGHYLIQMDTVDPDGTSSEPSNVAEVTVT